MSDIAAPRRPDPDAPPTTGTASPVRPRKGLASARSISVVVLLQIEVVLLAVMPSPLVIGPLGGFGAPARLVEVALFGVWMASFLPGQTRFRPCWPVRIVLLLFLFSVLLSAFIMYFHPMPGEELAGANRYLINLLCMSGVALAAAEGLRRREEVITIVRTAVYAFSFMALVGILQGRGGINLVTYFEAIPGLTRNTVMGELQVRNAMTRPPGTTMHPIEFGVLVAGFIGMAIWLALYDPEAKDRSRLLRWGPLALISFAVPVSISRSALLVAVVILVMYFAAATPSQRIQGAIVVFIGMCFVFVTVPGMIGTLTGFVTAGESDSSITSRTSDYATVAPLLRNSPWIGRGPGTFVPPTHTVLDNQFLLVLVEMGILGLLVTLLLLLAPAALARGARRRSVHHGDRFLGQMMAAAAVGFTLTSSTFDSLSFPTFRSTAVLLLGLSGALWMCAREQVGEIPASAPVDEPRLDARA